MEAGGDNRQLGAGIAIAGAAAMLLSVFLPLAESRSFTHVVDNSLIQHGEGWILVALAIGTTAAAYRTLTTGTKGTSVIVLGLLALGLAIYFGTSDDLLTLTSAAPTEDLGLEELLDIKSFSEKASPGVGIYAAGVGGLLATVGGWMMRPASKSTE